MAIKIVRQPGKVALIGAPTSAAALAPGHERAPAALRAAGLVERLQAVGLEVTDFGDCAPQLYQPDDDSPRARNMARVLAALNELKPRVEQAVKTGALPLILGGDCTIALGTLAGLRRYYRFLSLVYMDHDADLNVPATTPSGCIDGMVVAHIVGRGAAELVRFWGEPPLVREPDVALLGVGRWDPPEQEWLMRSPIRHYSVADVRRQGPVAAAEAALERIHVAGNPFLLHLDVDVIDSEEFSATNHPAPAGLRLAEVSQALEVFLRQEKLAAFEVTVYNPERDPEGTAAKTLIDLLASVFAARRAALVGAPPPVPATAEVKEAEEKAVTQPAPEPAEGVASIDVASAPVAAEEAPAEPTAVAEPSLPQDAPAGSTSEESERRES